MLEDNINFASREMFPELMGIFGWSIKEFKIYKDLAVVRADFYPVGHILGFSKKAIIVCDGETMIKFDGQIFTDFEELKTTIGEDLAYESFPQWEIVIEKQWAIKRNGEWIGAFSHLAEMPYRKQVRC